MLLILSFHCALTVNVYIYLKLAASYNYTILIIHFLIIIYYLNILVIVAIVTKTIFNNLFLKFIYTIYIFLQQNSILFTLLSLVILYRIRKYLYNI